MTFLLTWVVVRTVVIHFLKPVLGMNSESLGDMAKAEGEPSSISLSLEALENQNKHAT